METCSGNLTGAVQGTAGEAEQRWHAQARILSQEQLTKVPHLSMMSSSSMVIWSILLMT